jgi:starch phosphorylase
VTELSTHHVSPTGELAKLRRVAANLRWSWHRPAADLVASLPGADTRHPVAVVEALQPRDEALSRWLADHGEALAAEVSAVETLEMKADRPDVAYFSPEFGLVAQVPQYSGGLGILAGDHLKAASDLGLPLVGVGLFYRRGFFRQELAEGTQVEHYEDVDPVAVGAVDTGVLVEVPIDGEPVHLAVWEMWVGASRMLLLDSEIEENSPVARHITDRLYAGDRHHRLRQELVLGVGGVRALRALGITPAVYHLNEGHACFLLLELLAELVDGGVALGEARDRIHASTLFTTHTPVPAGIDRFERELVEPALEPWAERLGVTTTEILDWAWLPDDGPECPFNTAALALNLCGRVNGVSQLHAEVSRDLFASLPQAATIEGITNGVHARSWVSAPLQELYDEALGPGWENGDEAAWSRVHELDGEAFRGIHRASKAALIDLVYGLTGTQLDPDRCILGFARRFATYKRAHLLLKDPDGLEASVAAGAQFVFAGKAHPADTEGKAILAEIGRYARAHPEAGIVIVPGYDIDIAKALYAGCDVWLNNPVRPREACGTSGEKAALNGVLNCSISDGWWADWYTDGIGWIIPTSDAHDPDQRDREEAAALHRLLVGEVLRRHASPTEAWWLTVRDMLAHLGPLVTAGRMVREYDRRFYQPIRAS